MLARMIRYALNRIKQQTKILVSPANFVAFPQLRFVTMIANLVQHSSRFRFYLVFTAVALFFAITNSALATQQDVRVWSDNSGTFSIEAGLVATTADGVKLKKLNGVIIHVPFSRLSNFDLAFLKKQKKASITPKKIPAKQPTIPVDTPTKPPANLISSKPNPEPESIRLQDSSPPVAPGIETFTNFNYPIPSADSKGEVPSLQAVPAKLIQQLPEAFRGQATTISSGTNVTAVREALKELAKTWPAKNIPTLTKVIQSASKSTDPRSRKLAIEILAKHDAEKSFEIILNGINDPNFGVRWASYDWLERLRDHRAIEPLFKKFESKDRDQAASIVASFGPAVELEVLRLIEHESIDVRVTVCSLLGKIGTDKSLPTLKQKADKSSSTRVRLQAINASESIMRRMASSK